jgi:hypothetical protein
MAALATRKFITQGDQQNFPGFLQHLPGSCQRISRIHRIPQITFRSSPDRLRIFPRRSRRLHHQLRITSYRHHRAPYRPGRRASTPEENDKVLQCELSLDLDTYKRILELGHVLVGLSSCSVFDAVFVVRCYKCNGFNHTAKYCKNDSSCQLCGKHHPCSAVLYLISNLALLLPPHRVTRKEELSRLSRMNQKLSRAVSVLVNPINISAIAKTQYW